MKIGSMLLKVILALVVIIGISSCTKPGGTTVAHSNVDYYTCTMHPSVHSKTPGKCPICSMDLVPVLKKIANDSGPKDNSIEAGKGTPGAMTDNGSMGSMSMPSANQPPGNKPGEFSVPVERQQQIGVTYASAQRRPIQLSIRSVGVLEPDQAKIFEYVARVDGYIQDLRVTSPGEQVNAGEPLVTIYSPDLRSTEQELVNLLNERDRGGSRASLDQVIESSKRRLRQWNVSDQEINALEKSRKAAETLVLRSPFAGVVEDVPMKQGMSVKMGDRLLGVMDLSRLWLWADFYENEVGLLRVGQKLDISFPAFPGKKFEGQIGAIDRRLDAMKRTTRVRVDLDNPQDELRPGMFANVELKIDGGEGLTVPVDAVLPTGSRSLAFVDKGAGKLEPRFIRVGRSFSQTDANGGEASYDEVLEGLSEGERVVSSANFLIDAESRIQGALKTWDVESETKQQNSPATPAQSQKTPLGQNAVPAFQSVLAAYDRIHESLVKDQIDGVAAQAVSLRTSIRQLISSTPELIKEEGYRNTLAKLRRSAESFDARNLEDARAQFGFFSADLIAFLKVYPALADHPIYTINCPMWKESPAQWVQTTAQVKNPFLGKQMLDCGQVSGLLQAVK
jgi:membrane fusion protein, copper/silver efflux system